MKKDRAYLEHIQEGLDWITEFTGSGRELFLTDRKTHSAVLRELQTLAESTQRLSDPLKDRHPEIPWREVAGFRNVLVHGYLGISLERVWEIIQRDLPPLRQAVQEILAGMIAVDESPQVG